MRFEIFPAEQETDGGAKQLVPADRALCHAEGKYLVDDTEYNHTGTEADNGHIKTDGGHAPQLTFGKIGLQRDVIRMYRIVRIGFRIFDRFRLDFGLLRLVGYRMNFRFVNVAVVYFVFQLVKETHTLTLPNGFQRMRRHFRVPGATDCDIAIYYSMNAPNLQPIRGILHKLFADCLR